MQVLDLLKPESGARPSGSKPLQMRFDGSSGVRVEGLTEEVIVNGAPLPPVPTPFQRAPSRPLAAR